MEQKGVFLSEITFAEAEKLLNRDTVLVIPAGGGSKEHGHHLPLGTDMYVTQYVAEQVTKRCPVVTAPMAAYAYYPAFIQWPGSVTLEPDTFMKLMEDIILSFARFGVKKFLIIDGGVSTHAPLRILSSQMLNHHGLRVAVTNILGLGKEMEQAICQQERGGHGDEAETSCMLHIRPDLVHMDLAVEEYSESLPHASKNGITRVDMAGHMDTPHGINGNSTLATAEKGEKLLEAMVQDIVDFVGDFFAMEVEE